MLYKNFKTGRSRAWLLIKTKDKTDAQRKAKALYHYLRNEGEIDFVVIRADVVVDNGVYKIMVPVDAKNRTALKKAVDEIETIVGHGVITQLDVEINFPSPTYLAHGFVTYEERDHARKNYLPDQDDLGRIMKNSHGDNPWG